MKTEKKKTNVQGLWDTMKGIPYMYSEHTKRLKTERNKRNIWNIND